MSETHPSDSATSVSGSAKSASAAMIYLGLAVLALIGLRTISNTDFWTHLASGQAIAEHGIKTSDPYAFTTADKTWVKESWLYDLLLHKLGNPTVIGLIHLAAVLGGFFLLARVALRYACGTCVGLALLLSGWQLAPRFEPRPLLLCVLFIGWFFHVLESRNRNQALRNDWMLWALLLPVQVLWANLSLSFQLGIVIALAYTVATLFSGDKSAEADQPPPNKLPRALLPIGLLLASMVTPYGPGTLSAAIGHWTTDFSQTSSLWISPLATQIPADSLPSILIWVSLGLGACGLVLQKEAIPPIGLTVTAIVGAFIALSRFYHIAVMATLCLPFIAMSLQAISTALGTFADSAFKRERALAHSGTILLAVLSLLSAFVLVTNRYYVKTGSLSHFGLGATTELMPTAALPVLREHIPQDRLINSLINGSYLAAHSGKKVLFDHRGPLYGRDFFEQIDTALFANADIEASWQKFVETWGTEVALLNTVGPASTSTALWLLQNDWQPVYFDGTSLIMASNIPANAELFSMMDFKEAGLKKIDEARLAYRKALGGAQLAPIPPRLVGAARIMHEFKQYNHSLELNTLLTCGVPHYRPAWTARGIAEMATGKNEDAVASLRTAHEMQPNDLQGILNLSEAYSYTGEDAKAESMLALARERAGEQGAVLVEDRKNRVEKIREIRRRKMPQEKKRKGLN